MTTRLARQHQHAAFAEPPSHHRPGWSFAVITAVAVTFFAASSAPTPLYAVFRAQMKLSGITITAIFAVYALTLLVALLTVGSLSDHVGRRPVIMGSIALEIVAMATFIIAADAGGLLLARGLQGFATGTVATALAAGLTDLTAARGQHINSITPLLGMATGALAAGGVASAVRTPVPSVFWALVVLLTGLLVATATITETAQKRPGALASLRVRLAVSPTSRSALLTALPVLIAVWAIGGFVLSLGPTLSSTLSGSAHPSPLTGGALVATLTGCGAAAVTLLVRVEPVRILASGSIALAAGAAMIVAAALVRSSVLLFAGAGIAGFGFGAGFQGTLRTVMPTAAVTERASLAATIYTISYLSMSVPAVVSGAVEARSGIEFATPIIGGMVILLAATAPVVMIIRRGKSGDHAQSTR